MDSQQHPQQQQQQQQAANNLRPSSRGGGGGGLAGSASIGGGDNDNSNTNQLPALHHQQPQSHFAAAGRPELYQKCNRGSHCSDTSSAYSGSGTMTSVHSSSLDVDEVDLSGLVESVVDSDEEDLAESMDSLAVRDTVRECLEKDPSDRTDDDIETLLEFTKNLRAFTNMTLAVRRALCSVMVFAVVEKAGTMVMNNGEELDSWSVLINGHVQIEHSDGAKEELQVGDSFGILPTMVKLYHRGVMRTTCHDCQFVCITQTDYYRIHHQGEENTQKHEDGDGQLVMVTELRHAATEGGQRHGHVVIRGTPERLMLQLIENSMTDSTYVEDFLLTHRTFTPNPLSVAQQLLTWFETESTSPTAAATLANATSAGDNSNSPANPAQPLPPSPAPAVHPSPHIHASASAIRDRVAIVVLLWVNNHFTDFETDPHMMEFLETFEAGLERKVMHDRLRLLHFACAAKARTRSITLARSSRDEQLQFEIVGGYERGSSGIFISSVVRRSKPEEKGLKRGDQILEVNGHSFEHVTNARALELLKGSTHLSITVKSNLLGFKDLLAAGEDSTDSPRSRHVRRKALSDIAKLQHGSGMSASAGTAGARLSSIDLLSPDQTDCLMSNAGLLGGVGHPMPSPAAKYGGGIGTASAKKDAANKGGTGGGGGGSGGFLTLGPKRRLQKALIKMNLLPKTAVTLLMDGLIASGQADQEDSHSAGGGTNSTSSGSASSLHQSQSNPDLTAAVQQAASSTTTSYYDDFRHADYPEHVLKVYRADQSCKYLLVHKETTAHEVVMLALQEFGCHESSSMFSLCEVSVGDGGMIKQRRLPEQLQNLAERIGLAARYYLKTNGLTETLVPDEMAPDLIRDAAVHFLQLNANELAIQLTLQDFAIFRQIESTEYVDDLFMSSSSSSAAAAAAAAASAANADAQSIQSTASTSTTSSSATNQLNNNPSASVASSPATRYGIPMLRQFAELVNREMFWVVTEVCSEQNMVRRMKIVKQFVKIARHCKECRNFNSMFAIVSGLGHASVSRLRQTWEKLPGKYQRLFDDLQDLMDPSRNMSKYRQLVSAEMAHQHPIIPFYPVVKKDLTFIHLGNDTLVDGLINFEKLRMIAKEVRSLTKMCSKDLMQALELKGQPPSSAMVALNQMTSVATGGSGGSAGGNASSGGGGLSLGGLGMGLGLGGGQATVKRRKKSTAAPNPKKMFEEAQMVRRVKSYLNNMRVITDEDRLHQLSLECEPAASGDGRSGGGGGGGTGSNSGGGGSIGSGSGSGSAPSTVSGSRKRHPSPTLSTASSNSSSASEAGRKGAISAASAAYAATTANAGPKFGTASPQAVKKILSLSETTKTRPHQPRHPTPVLPGTNVQLGSVGSLNAPQSHGMHGLHHLLGVVGGGSNGLASHISPTPSPGAHRRVGSSSSAGSVPFGAGVHHTSTNDYTTMVAGCRGAVHERSHSDTRTPLPSVDLSVESSSVTSLSNMPLRKNLVSAGSITSNDSGHGSCAPTDQSDSASSSIQSGLYHVASSIVHNTPSPTMMQQQQRRNSAAMHVASNNPVGSLGGAAGGPQLSVPPRIKSPLPPHPSSASHPHQHQHHPSVAFHHHSQQQQQHLTSASTSAQSAAAAAASAAAATAAASAYLLQHSSSPIPPIQSAHNAGGVVDALHPPSQQQQLANLSQSTTSLLSTCSSASSASSAATTASASTASSVLSASAAAAAAAAAATAASSAASALAAAAMQQPPPLPPQSSSMLLASRQQQQQLHLQQQQQQHLQFGGGGTSPALASGPSASPTNLMHYNHHHHHQMHAHQQQQQQQQLQQLQQHHHHHHHHHPSTHVNQPSIHARTNVHGLMAPPPLPAPKSIGHQQQHQQQHSHHQQQQQQPMLPPRHPPAYSVAAQMARLHRLGRAHSHEGVLDVQQQQQIPQHLAHLQQQQQQQQQHLHQQQQQHLMGGSQFYYTHASNATPAGDEDDDDDAQVSAV